METVEISFKYIEKEYVRACRQYLFLSKTIRKSDIVMSIFMLIFAFVWCIYSSFNTLSTVLLVCVIFFIAIICIVYFLSPIFAYKQNTKYQEEYHLFFSNNGIKFETETINSNFQWNVYTDLCENHDYLYLIQTKRVYTIIPKRVFEDNIAMENFKDIVLSNLSDLKKVN